MNRPRLIRGLRIAWSVCWGILCVLLIVLWVRSHWNSGGLVRAFGIAWSSEDGALTLIYPEGIAADPNEEREWVSYSTLPDRPVQLAWRVNSYGLRFCGSWSLWIAVTHYAYPSIVFGTLATLAWLRLSFSLYTFLVAITVIAVVLGLVVWSMS